MLTPDLAAAGVLRPLKRVEYDRLVDAGVFDGERIELLAGVLVTMSPQGAPHSWIVSELTRLLVPALTGRAQVRVQLPFALSEDSEPEPDLALVPDQSWRLVHPDRAFLVVEVSRTTLRIDRAKADLYAQGSVPEYWLVDVEAECLQVYSQPVNGRYGSLVTHHRDAVVSPAAFPDVKIPVAGLF